MCFSFDMYVGIWVGCSLACPVIWIVIIVWEGGFLNYFREDVHLWILCMRDYFVCFYRCLSEGVGVGCYNFFWVFGWLATVGQISFVLGGFFVLFFLFLCCFGGLFSMVDMYSWFFFFWERKWHQLFCFGLFLTFGLWCVR